MERNPFSELNTERVKEVATRLGHFLFGSINAEVAYPSEHRRIIEPTDGEACEPQLPIEGGWCDMGTYLEREG